MLSRLICWLFGHQQPRNKLTSEASFLVSKPWCEFCERWIEP